MRAWDRSLSKATLPSHRLLRPYLSFFGTLCCRTSGSHLLELTCPRCWDSGQLSLEVLETLPGILYLFDTQHLVLFFVFVFVFHFLAFRCTRCFWARGNLSLLFELHFMGNKISSPDSSAAETNFAEGVGWRTRRQRISDLESRVAAHHPRSVIPSLELRQGRNAAPTSSWQTGFPLLQASHQRTETVAGVTGLLRSGRCV